MAQHPFAALTLDAMEVDQDDLSTGPQRIMDGLQGALRKLEMVVGVADENQIDAVRGQLGRELIALNRLDVLDLVLLAGLLDVSKRGRSNSHGIDFALFPDLGS